MEVIRPSDCAYELYVMNRAVADLAVMADDPARIHRVRDRANHRAGVPRMAIEIAIDDAVEGRPDRPIEDLCAMCDVRCGNRLTRNDALTASAGKSERPPGDPASVVFTLRPRRRSRTSS
jgi:hypothetical protein